MPTGITIEDINFSENALVDRPAHAAILGRIFTSWSLIEASVASLLGLIMHADSRAARAILRRIGTNQRKIEAVKEVAKALLEGEAQKEILTLMGTVAAYAKERNDIAHNLWGAHKEEPNLIYRMPMTELSDLVVTSTETMPASNDLVVRMRSKMKSFTVSELEEIETQGKVVLEQVMAKTMSMLNSRA